MNGYTRVHCAESEPKEGRHLCESKPKVMNQYLLAGGSIVNPFRGSNPEKLLSPRGGSAKYNSEAFNGTRNPLPYLLGTAPISRSDADE